MLHHLNFPGLTNIRCDEVPVNKYFKNNVCDGAFLTTEYTYDAQILKKYFLKEIEKLKNVEIIYGCNIDKIAKKDDVYEIILESNDKYESSFILNAKYLRN